MVIPSPFVADNHQLRNAMAMVDRGAAVVVEEKDFASGALSRAVIDLLDDAHKRRDLQENITAFAKLDANRLIYERILEAVEESKAKKKK